MRNFTQTVVELLRPRDVHIGGAARRLVGVLSPGLAAAAGHHEGQSFSSSNSVRLRIRPASQENIVEISARMPGTLRGPKRNRQTFATFCIFSSDSRFSTCDSVVYIHGNLESLGNLLITVRAAKGSYQRLGRARLTPVDLACA